MLVSGDRITMTQMEWQQFRAATWAPWRPRSRAEFDAMCDLAAARHLVENSEGHGFLHALAVEAMKFGPAGEANFPMDRRKMAYVKVHGQWPTDVQLDAVEAGTRPHHAQLVLVRS